MRKQESGAARKSNSSGEVRKDEETKMIWTCEQTEARLSDYLDGALVGAERAEFEAHVGECERCAPLVAHVSQLLSGMRSMEQLEAPPRLVYAILDKTLGPRDTATGWRAVLGWIQGVASIRFAYGALSVAGTLVILLSAAGFSWRKPKLADLQPANIYRNADRKAHLVYAQGTKFVNDLRVVSEIQSRLRQDSDLQTNPESVVPSSSPDKQPGHTDGSKPATPRQQNRADDITRQIQVLAEELPMWAGHVAVPLFARRLP
jgi:anti-sigma-K factor RskA